MSRGVQKSDFRRRLLWAKNLTNDVQKRVPEGDKKIKYVVYGTTCF